jgi:AraC-like DNA-binding protein
MECAIPWAMMGIVPRAGRSLGFDVNNTDRDYFQGAGFYQQCWGLTQINMLNPSEWGNLELHGPDRKPWIFAGILGFILLMAGGLLVVRRWNRPAIVLAKKPISKEMQKGLDYIAAHYGEENLDLNTIAQAVFLSPVYFSALFKNETGDSFIKYLNEYRIKKAEELLRNSKENITQVAFSVGFNKLDTFEKTFKKIKGISPKSFRNSCQTEKNPIDS